MTLVSLTYIHLWMNATETHWGIIVMNKNGNSEKSIEHFHLYAHYMHTTGTLKIFAIVINNYCYFSQTGIQNYWVIFKWLLHGNKWTKECIYSQIA